MTNVNDFFDSLGQAATPSEQTAPDKNNIPDLLYQSLHTYVTSCITHDLSEQQFVYNEITTHPIVHLNICPLQSHFDELNEFLLSFSSPPFVIFISETRINVEPLINVNIPSYTFHRLPSNTRAGTHNTRAAYFLENLTVRNKGNFGFNIEGCENLWFDVEFPGQKQKFTLAVIYRHPHNNMSEFINALDEKLNILDEEKSNKVYILEDINLDLNSNSLSSSASDYLRMLQSHAYFSLTTKPTRVTHCKSNWVT